MMFRSLSSVFVAFAVLIVWTNSVSAQNEEQRRKPQKKGHKKYLFQDKLQKHKQLLDLAKKLEYDVNLKEGDNSLDFGLTPIDLNLFEDEEFATDVVDGVEEELSVIDQEFGETEKESNQTSVSVNISLMHQGMYSPSPEYNALIDGVVENVKKDLDKREMDPLYFGIHNRGVIRHSSIGKTRLQPGIFTVSDKSKSKNESASSDIPIGIGVIKGLSKLKRFGNAESRKDGDVTLVRSHYFFGPLDIDLIFGSRRGIRILNTTLSSLAGHALIELMNHDNSTTLKEFISDSPMEYEIRLRGAKNRRFRSLSQTSISRLFKRGGRMETRLMRSFRRGLRKPILDGDQKRSKNKQNNKDKKNQGKRQSGKVDVIEFHSFLDPYSITSR